MLILHNPALHTARPKKVAILQSNYIPWKGYFDLINMVDEFILYDDVQYTRQDWRNRNLIKTPRGAEWLTIPVGVKGIYNTAIKDKKTDSPHWAQKHFGSIVQNYRKAKYFKEYRPLLEHLYFDASDSYLSQINFRFIQAICNQLGITTKLSWSMDYPLCEGKNERLLDLCKQVDASTYISGPAAKSYLDEELFATSNINVEWMDYSGYPEYNQLFPPFVHGVTILDLILNEGPRSHEFMKSFGETCHVGSV